MHGVQRPFHQPLRVGDREIVPEAEVWSFQAKQIGLKETGASGGGTANASLRDYHNYLVTAERIDGDWSDPIYLNSSGFDPSQPFFTFNGSFWTNSITKLLASTSEADRQARTRSRRTTRWTLSRSSHEPS